MYRHLFLEGSIQAGKSTLLRELLTPYMSQVGGFASQRMLNDDGRTIGYRIGPASDTSLTIPFEEGALLPGIFRIIHKSGKSEKFPEVFDREGIEYLRDNNGKKLLLLDEIGGAELLNEKFRNTLYDVLAGEIPCIGVIKLAEKAAFMTKTAGYHSSVLEYNEELRDKITSSFQGKILKFSRNDENVRKEIQEFLCGIFMNE